MATSSAIKAASVSASVSPGTAIMSRPTEQTAVIASSLASVRSPRSTAAASAASSLTATKAPESPPTDDEAKLPPFLTASFKSASAAVEPGAPIRKTPIAWRISPTESPTCGVGASDRSTIPNGTPSLEATSRPINSPTRVTRKAVLLMTSATSPSVGLMAEWAIKSSTAALTTPGPLTPMLITQSGSPGPWNAPAMNGLSLGALAKITSLAQPNPSWSRVRSAVSFKTCPSARIASMLIPAAVVPTFTLAQTRFVVESTNGRV